MDLNPRKPMTLFSRIGCVSVVAAFGSYSSFSFQRNLNGPNGPGLTIVAAEMRGSVRTHAVRCASAPLVVHSAPPRPCACRIAPADAHAIPDTQPAAILFVVTFPAAPRCPGARDPAPP